MRLVALSLVLIQQCQDHHRAGAHYNRPPWVPKVVKRQEQQQITYTANGTKGQVLECDQGSFHQASRIAHCRGVMQRFY